MQMSVPISSLAGGRRFADIAECAPSFLGTLDPMLVTDALLVATITIAIGGAALFFAMIVKRCACKKEGNVQRVKRKQM